MTSHAGGDAPRLSRVAGGTFATVLARGLDVGATYVFYAVIARAVPVGEFGAFLVALAVLQVAGTVARGGLDQSILTVPPSAGANRRVALTLAATSTAIVGAAAAASFVAGYRPAAWQVVLAVSLPVTTIAQFVIASLRARSDVALAAFAEGVAQPALSAILALAAARFMPGLAGFSIALLASWAALLLFAIRLEWRGPALEASASHSLVTTARSMLGVSLLNQAASSADVLLLGAIAHVAEVGNYGAASKIATAFVLLFAAVNSATAPYMRPIASDRKAIAAFYELVSRWMLAAAVPLLVVTIGTPSLLLRLFGEKYVAGGALPLVLQSTAAGIMLMTGPAGTVLMCTGNAKRLLWTSAAGTVALVAAVAGLAHLGAAGAALGVLIGRVIGRGLSIAALRNTVTDSLLHPAIVLIALSTAGGVIVARATLSSAGELAAAAAGSATAAILCCLILARIGDFRLVLHEVLKK